MKGRKASYRRCWKYRLDSAKMLCGGKIIKNSSKIGEYFLSISGIVLPIQVRRAFGIMLFVRLFGLMLL